LKHNKKNFPAGAGKFFYRLQRSPAILQIPGRRTDDPAGMDDAMQRISPQTIMSSSRAGSQASWMSTPPTMRQDSDQNARYERRLVTDRRVAKVAAWI